MQINHSRNPQNRQVGGSTWQTSAKATEILTNEDIAYVPAIMTQVFFPQKPLPPEQLRYQTDHGRARSLRSSRFSGET